MEEPTLVVEPIVKERVLEVENEITSRDDIPTVGVKRKNNRTHLLRSYD